MKWIWLCPRCGHTRPRMTGEGILDVESCFRCIQWVGPHTTAHTMTKGQLWPKNLAGVTFPG